MLSLILVGIMIGAVLYIVSTILKYTTFFSEIVSTINRQEKRQETLAEGVENEEKLGEIMADQVEQEMTYLSKLKVEIGEVKQEFRVAEKKTDKLEFQVHKTGKLLPGESENSK